MDIDPALYDASLIPSAVNISSSQAVQDDGTFKSASELITLYTGKGITQEEEVIAYWRGALANGLRSPGWRVNTRWAIPPSAIMLDCGSNGGT